MLYNRQRNRRFYTVSILVHVAVLLTSLVSFYSCRHEVPAGVPRGEGDKLTMGKVVVVRTPQRVFRRRRVRQSPVSVFEMIRDEDMQEEARMREQFSDAVGVPGGIGEGAAAAGSPHGTALGGKLHFYRIKFDGPGWDANGQGVRPLMQEILKAGVVKEVSGLNNVVPLSRLPEHTGKFLPHLLFMTGHGQINASDQEVRHLRDYLESGGMLFVDVNGGDFYQHFAQFMRRVLPNRELREIEADHEIYRGRSMPYAMVRGCPIYRQHRGPNRAMGIWIGPRISVFVSTGSLGSAWSTAGMFRTRRRDVEQAFRMSVNIVSYSLLYYKYGQAESS